MFLADIPVVDLGILGGTNSLSFIEKCTESVAAFAFGATSLALSAAVPAASTIAGAAVGPAVAGVTLAGIAIAACLRHGPESRHALEAIRKQVQSSWKRDPNFDRSTEEDLQRAGEELHWHLKDCMLDRRELARTITNSERFPEAATELVMIELGKRNARFLPVGTHPVADETANKFARKVIRTAFEAAIENEAWFRTFLPWAVLEIAGTAGEALWEIKAARVDVLRLETKLDGLISRLDAEGAFVATAEKGLSRAEAIGIVAAFGHNLVPDDQVASVLLGYAAKYQILREASEAIRSGDLTRADVLSAEAGFPRQSSLLASKGPHLSVDLRIGDVWMTGFDALIDTGAAISVADTSLEDEFRRHGHPIDMQQVQAIGQVLTAPLYRMRLRIPALDHEAWLKVIILPLHIASRDNVKIIVGRDALRELDLEYDGRSGSVLVRASQRKTLN